MDRKEREQLYTEFNSVCTKYVDAFCAKHGFDKPEPLNWVGDRVGETIEIADNFYNFNDIRYDIDTEQRVGIIEGYMEYMYDLAMTVLLHFVLADDTDNLTLLNPSLASVLGSAFSPIRERLAAKVNLECPKTINYRAWADGAPRPYTQEQLDAIRKAHNEVALAKQYLEDLLNDR